MNLRKYFFFKLDKDNLIKNQLEEIEKANSNDDFAIELQEKSINELISYVNKFVPYYQKLNISEFENLPIVDKVMMKNDINLFRTTEEITIGKIRHTSGSTGIPFEIFQDLKKAKRVQAEVIYYRGITGDEIGTKYVNLISPSNIEKTSKLSNIKQNAILFDVTKMTNSVLNNLIDLLSHNKNIKYMLGYSSALEKIANYAEENEYKNVGSLKAVVSSSEIMSDTLMRRLNNIFNCPVYDRYSNEDNGFIAQTDGISHDFLVNRGSYFIEILRLDSNEPANENELGRIVITDLFNYAQPFLRYDTGDLGSYSYKQVNGCKRYVLTKLEGRRSDVVYDNEDNPVSTFSIGCALETFTNIKQYQLIQETKLEFTLNINDDSHCYKDEEYLTVLKKILGNNTIVKINYVDIIPTLNSGKFKRVICNYSPK